MTELESEGDERETSIMNQLSLEHEHRGRRTSMTAARNNEAS